MHALFAAHTLVACTVVDIGTAYAATPEEQGLAIAVEADRRDSGFGDSSALLKMTLSTSGGDTVKREMRQKTLEVADDGDKTIMVFDNPRDIKGTAVLTYSHKSGSDDQWLYLPALKRVKRISSSDKSGPFMGSEFAFEDLSSQEVEKYNYKYLGEETVDGEDCFVVERLPLDEKSGYTRQVVWVDKAEYRPRKIDYFDRRGELLKTMTMRGYQQYLDKFWRATDMIMHNHQTNKTTTLTYTNYQFQSGMQEQEFTRNALSNVR
jgi:outer membrane lipoprotein-sorting protein